MIRLRGKPFRVSRLAVLLLFGGILNMAIHTSVSGQAQDASKPAPLTVQEVQALRQKAQEAADLSDEGKAKALKTYDQALEQLQIAADWSAKAAAFDKAREEAPKQVEVLEKELLQPLPSTDPEVPPDATQEQLEQRLIEVGLDRDATRDELSRLENDFRGRIARRKQLPELLTGAGERLREEREKSEEASAGQGAADLLRAQRTLGKARIQAVEAEIEALRREQPSYEAQAKQLTLRLDLAVRDLSIREKQVKAWQEVVSARRREEADKDAKKAREALLEATSASPEIRLLAEKLASENAALAEQRAGPEGLLRRMEQTSRRLQETKESLDRIKTNFAGVQQRVEAGGGLNAATGVLLRKNKAELPYLASYKGDVRKRREEIEDVQVRTIELREARTEVSDMEAVVSEAMSGAGTALEPYQRIRMERLLRDLLWTNRNSLESLLNDYTDYFEKLIELDAAERELIRTVEAFHEFINERILWIRSVRPLALSNFWGSMPPLRWMAHPAHWKEAVEALGSDVTDNPLLYGFFFILFSLWLIGRRKTRARMKKANEEAAEVWCTSFGYTPEALLWMLLKAAYWPAIVLFLGWRLSGVGEQAGFVASIGSGLRFTAIVFLTLQVARYLIRSDGLGVIHFGWPSGLLKEIHGHWARLTLISVPAIFVVAALQAQPDEAWKGTLGRLVFLVLMVALAVYGHRMFRSALRQKGARQTIEGGWTRFSRVIHVLAMGLPISIGGIAMLGYQYAAVQLSLRLLATLCFLLVVLVLNGMIHRWLLIASRRLAVAENRKHREADVKQAEGETGGDAEGTEKEEIDLAKVQVQTNRLARGIILIAVVLGVWMIWADVVAALGVLDQVELWHTTREVSDALVDASGNTRLETREQLVPVTLADLFLAVLILLMTGVAARNLPGLLGVFLVQRFRMGTGEKTAISTIFQYAIGFTGALLAFKTLGIGWGNIQWLVAALGVGIGFGLQEVVANFICGLILLFERPIRVGDAVTVGDVSGTVTKIRIRATSITTWERKEFIVPNKEFIVGKLVNWTLSDTVIRVALPVGIAYGSDTEKAAKLLVEVARAHPKALKDPVPVALFMGFGSSSLDFELRAYTHYEFALSFRHDLHMAVDKTFREAGIEIAFPQQDIHIRSVEDSFLIAAKEADGKPE